jgi:predicted nucleic acid-binding protein
MQNSPSAFLGSSAGGNLTTDAHLAALAVETRSVVYTTDTDFVRFSGVKWVNPLAA